MICPKCHIAMVLVGCSDSTKETIHEWHCFECHYSFKDIQKKEDYVPKNEITTIPSGWNEAGSFDFLNDSKEDIYSLEDGEEIA